jgi:hypothetical protein
MRMKQVDTVKPNHYFKKHFTLAAFCLIAALILLAYSNAFTSSFHFDDSPAINENVYIKTASMENIRGIILGSRPVVYLTIFLNYQLNGLNVVGWHIFNIGLHIATSFLVYLFLLRTMNMAAAIGTEEGKAKGMALFGALIFGVHPIQTESVTYIISRSEMLATFFYLGAIILFSWGAQTGRKRYYWGAFISSVLAMGSKEWAVTLPAIILLYDYLIISKRNIRAVLARWPVYLLIALSCLVVFRTLNLFAAGSSVGFNMSAPSSAASGPGARKALTGWAYFMTSCNVIWTYIRLLFLPIGQNIDYDYPIAQSLLEFPTAVSFLGHVAVIAGAFWLYWKKKWVLVPFGVAWFYITLSPVQSIVPVSDVIFEHRLYLPSVGFFLAFVVLFNMTIDRLTGNKHIEVKPGKQAASNKNRKKKVKSGDLIGQVN